jgi:hypothetical protein
MSEVADELFLMTNLFPADTGLPMVVWVGPSYGVGHDVRIKVMQHHGTRMDPGDLAVRYPQDRYVFGFRTGQGRSRPGAGARTGCQNASASSG